MEDKDCVQVLVAEYGIVKNERRLTSIFSIATQILSPYTCLFWPPSLEYLCR